MHNMNKRMVRAAFGMTLALWFAAAQAAALPTLEPLPDQGRVAHLSAALIGQYHYLHTDLDDTASVKIFDSYLKSLDSERVFFLKSDVDRLAAAARVRLDDAILDEDMKLPFDIFNLYRQRVIERIAYARSLLGKGFDFSTDESYEYSRGKAPWVVSVREMDDLWRKRVKNDWLRLKLAGKNGPEIAAILDKRYDNLLSGISKLKSDDVFQSFMTAYTTSIDPHTDYFGARASGEFDIAMRLSLFGIGAVLQDKDEYVTIRELVAGGPAALSGKLKVGDRIVGVAQGEDGAPAEVTGLRLDDAVALIRGEENSVVVLDVLPAGAGPDAQHQRITLVRKKISLDKQAAKKSVIEVKDGQATHRVGVISLPGFYQDFAARERGDPDFKSAARDVSRILQEFRQEKVDSVLVDLRNNGGGSLDEAVELTGLFIGKGPVVQQRDANGDVSVGVYAGDAAAWNGPLGVLINRGSASASEIFAAAIQDYGRGIVIGEPSFGKGTVQSILNLDQITDNEKPQFGELKMTIAQFFRVNGGTTQLRGVTPDIRFPSAVNAEDFGESSYPNALQWTHITPADYAPSGDLAAIVPLLSARHDARVSDDKDFRYLREDIAELSSWRKKNRISLNEAERRKERDAQEARMKLRERDKSADDAGGDDALVFRDDGLQSSERNLDTDIALEKARKNAKDVLLDEAAHILGDEVGLIETDAKLAANVRLH